jgi:Fe2+ or Zn2+ uptake regulation protein
MVPEEVLKQHGLKATAARTAVLAAIAKSKAPLSVQAVVETLRGTADQATVYRALQTFSEKGIVRRVDLGQGHATFEMDGAAHHHHLVCVSCGAVEDVEDCDADAFAAQALKRSKSFARVSRHSLELFGECKDCAT